jgi:hypothetical protein
LEYVPLALALALFAEMPPELLRDVARPRPSKRRDQRGPGYGRSERARRKRERQRLHRESAARQIAAEIAARKQRAA